MHSSIFWSSQELTIPFSQLDQDTAEKLDALERWNVELANRIMSLPQKDRRSLNSKHFADMHLGGAWINHTIRKVRAQSKSHSFYSMPLETDGNNWRLSRSEDVFFVSFRLFRRKKSRFPLHVKDVSHMHSLELLLRGDVRPGNIRILRSRQGFWSINITLLLERKIVDRWLGVDRGKMIPVAAASPDGPVTFLKDREILRIVLEFDKLRSKLRMDDREKLKELERKEKDAITLINKSISKELLDMAESLKAGIRLEALPNPYHLDDLSNDSYSIVKDWSHWAFCQLDAFIKQEAQNRGVVIDVVPPDFTSQTCCRCGAINKRRRQSFVCKRCRHKLHADANAALVIRDWYGMYCPLDVGVVTGKHKASS